MEKCTGEEERRVNRRIRKGEEGKVKEGMGVRSRGKERNKEANTQKK